jgi:sigma-B regulation protein RsbU (phosphoserine phosphatase)
VNISIKSSWARAGKVEKAFIVALVPYLILRLAWPDSGIEGFMALVTYVLGAWVGLRLLRTALRKITWRLRNRLMVAYLFIAVLPILLVVVLAALGSYMLAGQVAVYLARSELDRRLLALRSVAQDLGASPTAIQRIGEAEQRPFPGLVLWETYHGVTRQWPSDAKAGIPSGLHGFSGLALDQGRYYAWAEVVSSDEQVLALAPLSRRYLSAMMPGLGDVYFTQRELLVPESGETTGEAKVIVKGPSTKAGAGEDAQFRLAPAGGETSRPALPPPVNQFDLDVQWGSLLRAVEWAHPDKSDRALLLVHTRMSALFATILSQGGDELQGGVLVIFYAVAIAFLVVGVAGLAIGVSMSRSITGAVHSLYEGTQRVLRGDFSHLIPVTGQDQLAELSTSFNSMTENLERLLVVAKEKERMEAEIEIARGVQDQLYPKEPPVFEALRVLGSCSPARMVSGDYYDYQLVDGKLAIAIGDVAGKGISAALLMATIQAALRMELRAAVELAMPSMNGQRFSTARMVSELNQQLYATTSPEKYATFFFAIYDQATGFLTYTNGGHLQPVLFRDGTATLLDVSGLMVGAFPFAKYEESKLELRSGDLLVCYTDGITEPENEYGEMFGEERLIELVSKNADRDEAQIIESVMESVRQWTGVPELSDDMTVLLARKR